MLERLVPSNVCGLPLETPVTVSIKVRPETRMMVASVLALVLTDTIGMATEKAGSLITHAEVEPATSNRLGAFRLDRAKAGGGAHKSAGCAVVLISKTGRRRNNGQDRKLCGNGGAQGLVDRRLCRADEMRIAATHYR